MSSFVFLEAGGHGDVGGRHVGPHLQHLVRRGHERGAWFAGVFVALLRPDLLRQSAEQAAEPTLRLRVAVVWLDVPSSLPPSALILASPGFSIGYMASAAAICSAETPAMLP